MILFNSFLCLVIVVRIMLYERHDSRHRPVISLIAYAITVAAGTEVIQAVLGCATIPSYSTLVLNAVLCLALLSSYGNVAELFKFSLIGRCKQSQVLRWLPKTHNKTKVQ